MKKEKFANSKDCVCLNLRMASRMVTQHYEEALRPLNLKATQYSLLVVIYMRESISISETAALLRMDRTSMTRSLNPLVRDGLVEIKPGADRRRKLLALTKTGEKSLHKAFPLWEKAQKEIVSILEEENWAQIKSELNQLGKKLAPDK